jgi:hypothetical protein
MKKILDAQRPNKPIGNSVRDAQKVDVLELGNGYGFESVGKGTLLE